MRPKLTRPALEGGRVVSNDVTLSNTSKCHMDPSANNSPRPICFNVAHPNRKGRHYHASYEEGGLVISETYPDPARVARRRPSAWLAVGSVCSATATATYCWTALQSAFQLFWLSPSALAQGWKLVISLGRVFFFFLSGNTTLQPTGIVCPCQP